MIPSNGFKYSYRCRQPTLKPCRSPLDHHHNCHPTAPTLPQAGSSSSLLDALKPPNALDAAPSSALVLHNKAPRWNENMRAFCLNFGGRVSVASVKNFQLVAEGDPDTVVLQFGKAGDETFTCDFRWPLTPLQAFGICLSSFDSKLACE